MAFCIFVKGFSLSDSQWVGPSSRGSSSGVSYLRLVRCVWLFVVQFIRTPGSRGSRSL
jgi:hypothetical protein